MRSIYKIVVCSLLTLSITSCEKNLLEKEQYQKESDELASIRDWLLPMLMNGQAAIED